MDVPRGIGKNIPTEVFVRTLKARRRGGKRLPESRRNLVRDRLPDGPVADGPEVLDHIINHVASQRTEFLPIAGVEGLIR
jgi:hypothetical protein